LSIRSDRTEMNV